MLIRNKWFNMMNFEDFMTQENQFLEEAEGIPDAVPNVDYKDLDKKTFYRDYLSKSKPVLIKGMA